jgi:spermidine synthase
VSRDRTLAWALFSVGLTAIIGQILLMRELVATLYGNELLFGLILAAWLGWGAIGAALEGRRGPAGSGMTFMAAGLAAAALLLPAQLALVRALRTLLGATPGSVLDLGPLVLAVLLILAPLCLCLGALFSAGARLAVEGARTPGWAYVWDSVGAVAGGILFSFLFIRWLNPFQTAFLVGALDVAVVLLLAPHPAKLHDDHGATARPPGETADGDVAQATGLSSRHQTQSSGLRYRLISGTGTAVAIGTLAVLTAAAFPLGRTAQRATLRLEWPDAARSGDGSPASGAAQSLLFSGDSPYGRLAVQARGNQRIFYTDGALAFETQSTFPEEVAHLALLAHPAPRDVLLIGGGIAGDLREILKHPVDSITYVELDPLLIEAARKYLPAADVAPLDDPRVRTVLTDGRAFVEQPGLSYDAIILDLPEPTTGALNRFYTAEFFAQAKALLRPGGILSFGLPSAENYWNPELAQRNASIYRTLGSVFPSVTVLPGGHDFFLAGSESLEIDASLMAERMAQRGIQTQWITPAYLRDLLMGDRFVEAQARVKQETGVRINRDLSPLSYYYSLAHWLARFYPELRQAFEGARLISMGWLALPLIPCVLLARRRRTWAVLLVVAGVGLAQMLLELVLLFAFQARHGSLYGEVSLIVTAFMAGLAAGGAAGNRLLAGSYVRRKTQNVRRALAATLALMGAYSIVLPLVFSVPLRAEGIPQRIFLPLALIGGLLGGMVFPLASGWLMADGRGRKVEGGSPVGDQSAIRNRQSAIGGILYSADLAGGCLGALIGAALFIPIFGIPQTCAAIAVLAIAGLLAIL